MSHNSGLQQTQRRDPRLETGQSRDALCLVQQLRSLRGIPGAQGDLLGAGLLAGQDQHHQGIALLAGQGICLLPEIAEGLQRLAGVIGDGVGQGQVAADIGIAGFAGEGLAQGGLASRGVAGEQPGEAQPAPAAAVVQGLRRMLQQGHGKCCLTLAQIQGALAELAARIVRRQAQGLTIGRRSARKVVAGQANVAEAAPEIRIRPGQLAGPLIERRCRGVVAALGDVIGQLGKTSLFIIPRGVAASREQQGQSESESATTGHRTASWRWTRSASVAVACPSWDRRGRRITVPGAWLPACLVLLLALPAQARVEPAWWPQPYPYVVVDQPLQEVLEAFGRNLGLPLDVDATVEGQAPARLEAATAGEFLEALARSARLAWFYDGNTLHVTPAARNQQQRIATGGLAVAQVQERLDAYGVSGNPLALRALPGAGGILASGSPAFVEWLRQRLETPPAIATRAPSQGGVRVFRGAAREETVPVRAASSP